MDKLPNDILWILLALFGGIARYLDTYLKKKEDFSVAKMLATVIVCSFCGYMAAMTAALLYPTWTMVAAGVGGYIGVEALNLLYTVWKNKFTLDGNKKDDDTK
jgi:hypothetical protein